MDGSINHSSRTEDLINSFTQFAKQFTNSPDHKQSNNEKQADSIQEEQKIEQKMNPRHENLILINFMNPQFNIQYHSANTQMILTTPLDCQLIIKRYILPYDKFGLDKKSVNKLIFNQLETYVLNYNQDAKKQVQWIEQQQNKQFQKIIGCDYTIFMYQTFQLDKSDVDFTKTFDEQNQDELQKNISIYIYIYKRQRNKNLKYLWNNEMRREILSIQVGQLKADINRQQFDQFKNMVDFIERATISQQQFEDLQRIYRKKLNDLSQIGPKTIESQLKKKMIDIQDKYAIEKSRLEYFIKNGSLTLLDDLNKSFLQSKLDNIKVIETFYNNESRKSELMISNIEIINQMDLVGQDLIEYKSVLKQQQQTDPDKKQQQIFKMVKRYFSTSVTSSKAGWFVYDQFDININPLIIKLTNELYDKFYSYFFDHQIEKEKLGPIINEKYGKEKEKLKNMNADFQKIIPDLYQSIQVSAMKVTLTFKHPSKLMRLKDVSVFLDPYLIPKTQFWTTQELFDDFAAFVIKQITSQIFSILGQKFFGFNRDQKEQKQLKSDSLAQPHQQ